MMECSICGQKIPDDDAQTTPGGVFCPACRPDEDPAPTNQQNPDNGGEDADLLVSDWQDADFANPTAGVWPDALLDREQWMGHVEKKPFAPWADRDHPDADPDEDARWKWGITDNYVDGETIAMAEVDDRIDGRAFLQQPDDPFAYVDGDDVRDPVTGEVHPAFVEVLEELGLTYADVSQSGAGVHAMYRGELPEGVKQAAWQLDDEPWGTNDECPSIEIYAGKRVCVATGEHVPGTPNDLREWDEAGLEDVLDEHGQLPDPDRVSTDRDDYDLEDYDPDATDASDTAKDIRDAFAALDRLDARRVAADTIVHRWNDDASTSGDNRAFYPTWGKNSNGTANIVDRDIWQDTGDRGGYGGPVVMAAIDCPDLSIDERATPRDVRSADWFTAYEHLRDDLGYPLPELDLDSQQPPDLSEDDPLDLDVTLDISTAWRAASTVTPDDLEVELDLETTDDAWICPHCGDPVQDVVRALALTTGALDACDHRLDDGETYDRLYTAAREEYAAPLPRYVSSATATEDMDLAYGATGALRGWHILDSVRSQVTDDAPDGDAVAVLDPTWEDSDSGERIVLFESGLFYCREHEIAFDPLRLVALEHDLIHQEDASLAGADFLDAYRLARSEYGANLPEIVWNHPDADREPEHMPVLPAPEELIGEGVTTDADELEAAYDDVQALYDGILDDRSRAYLMTVLPALGKTTTVIKTASEEPTLYVAKRKELMQQAMEKAETHDVNAMYLPVFGSPPPDEKLEQAVAIVRDEGRDLLQCREELLERVGDWTDEDDEDGADPSTEEFDTLTEQRLYEQEMANRDDDEVHLDRESCGTGDGLHGPAWQLVVHVARALGSRPREIHANDTTIFGEELPCHDEGSCGYAAAWERATDPHAPKDLLIGHYIHAHVQGARRYAYYDEVGTDEVRRVDARTIAIDEFPGDVYTQDFGEAYLDHATWLARCLHPDVQDIQDLQEHRDTLWHDDFVQDWIQGEADLAALNVVTRLLDVLDDEDTDPTDADVDPTLPDDTRVSHDLRALVERALEAYRQDPEEAEDVLEAARRALTGGRDGIEALVAGADDGDAHPAARWLLLAQLAPEDLDVDRAVDVDDEDLAVTQVIETDSFAFGQYDQAGTRLKRVAVQAGHREVQVLLDRNQNGASLRKPPSFETAGGANTVVGLDATGRPELWHEAIGRDPDVRDIHETDRERRAFLRDTMNLQVVQTSPHVNSYEGDPSGKNFDGDVALIEAIADEFSQQMVTQDRLAMSTQPGVITTKCVRQVIGDRLQDAGAGVVGNFGNVTGSNAFGEHNIGVVLGAQHYGDAEIEKWAAFAGDEVEHEGHGHDLDYGSEIANAFLKHMREDQVMQAIMRFGRDEEGAVVFAHTSALREDLPVVADAAVVRAFSPTAQQVAEAARQHVEDEFTITDIIDDVDCSRRSVRRALNEFANLGYLEKQETSIGLANTFAIEDDPGAGDVELPGEIEPPAPGGDGPDPGGEPGQSGLEESNTGFVWVAGYSDDHTPRVSADRTVLPAPESFATTGPPD